MAVATLFLFAIPVISYSTGTDCVFREASEAIKAENYAGARTLFEQACNEGHSISCFNAGLMQGGSGGSQNLTQAVKQYNLACNGGLTQGCHHEGLMYESGSGVTQDIDKAKILFGIACQSGYAKSCAKDR